VLGGITGWVPDEAVVGRAIVRATQQAHDLPGQVRYRTTDTHYLEFFHTRQFQQQFPGRTTTRYITGAGFDTISRYAQTIRAKVPNAQIYCIVKLATEVDTKDVNKAHAAVLLQSDEDTVSCHDPSGYAEIGRAHRRMHKQSFATRWAEAHNVAMLVVHLPAA